MRKISHYPAATIVAFAAAFGIAGAQDGVPIIVPSQSSIYNQNSVMLPTPAMPSGQDLVRGADGVTCQTAIGGSGAYFDMGVIGSQDVFSRDTAAVYGRIVIPLGERPRRLDCSRLYELEIARMRMEIDMMRLGAALPPGLAAEAPPPAQIPSKDAVLVPPRATPQAPDLSPYRRGVVAEPVTANAVTRLAVNDRRMGPPL